MTVVLQHRDKIVKDGLARAVRLLVLPLIAELWQADIANVRKRMSRLTKAGYYKQISIDAQLPPDVSEPLCVARPGSPLPNFHKVAYAAKRRHELGPPPKRMVAYVASRRTLAPYGMRSKKPKRHQQTHDLGLAAWWIHHVAKLRRWPLRDAIGEDLFPPRGTGEKVEDLLLCTDGDIDRPYMAIDFISSAYCADRIEALARDILARDLPFIFA